MVMNSRGEEQKVSHSHNLDLDLFLSLFAATNTGTRNQILETSMPTSCGERSKPTYYCTASAASSRVLGIALSADEAGRFNLANIFSP